MITNYCCSIRERLTDALTKCLSRDDNPINDVAPAQGSRCVAAVCPAPGQLVDIRV